MLARVHIETQREREHKQGDTSKSELWRTPRLQMSGILETAWFQAYFGMRGEGMEETEGPLPEACLPEFIKKLHERSLGTI